MKLDVTDENNVRDVINTIVEKYGKIDFAVNNAGIAQYPAPIIKTETGSTLIMDGGLHLNIQNSRSLLRRANYGN